MEKKAPSIYPSNCFAEPRQRQPEHGADPRPLQLYLEPRDGRLRLHRRQPAEEAQRRRPDRLGGVHCDGRQQEKDLNSIPPPSYRGGEFTQPFLHINIRHFLFSRWLFVAGVSSQTVFNNGIALSWSES